MVLVRVSPEAQVFSSIPFSSLRRRGSGRSRASGYLYAPWGVEQPYWHTPPPSDDNRGDQEREEDGDDEFDDTDSCGIYDDSESDDNGSDDNGSNGDEKSQDSSSSCSSPPDDAGEAPGQKPQPSKFPRISKPVELLQASYDCVVVGSGYGGGVAASRMARAGQSVCLLERGEERWPGEYPWTTADVARDIHYSGDFAPGSLDGAPVESGSPVGMYHMLLGRGQSAVVCNGLGGTSLINANVFLEADAGTLGMAFWPPEIRENPGCLEEYYRKAREVLEPEPYPDHWPRLPKVDVFEKQAAALGMRGRFYKVPQTTRFRKGPNSCGVVMAPSTLTGQDATGINDGSKTTTLVTYLADAWNWGADMFCGCEVRHIEKAPESRGGYIVYFAWHGRGRSRFGGDAVRRDLMWVHARSAVFLGAGALGTTEILLRSKAMGLGMSDRIGQGMSGNGDMLAFGCETDCRVHAVGSERPPPDDPVGPTINTVIDTRGAHKNPLHDFVIQEGAIPRALADALHALLAFGPNQPADGSKTLLERAYDAVAWCRSLLLGPSSRGGAYDKTQVLLVMSHDGSQATLRLRDDKPVFEFFGVDQSERVAKLNALLAKAAEAVGGTLVQSPYCSLMGGQQVTVHPLGGACMARDGTPASGVTNHLGEVFAGPGTRETHAGLVVVDGAAVPAALGVNPLATITALAERAVAEFARARGLSISTEPNGVLDLSGPPAHRPKRKPAADAGTERRIRAAAASGLGFTELMTGFLHTGPGVAVAGGGGDRPAYETAHRAARSRGEAARLFVSVADVDAAAPQPSGMLTGTLVCPTMPGSPFLVLRGELGFFRPSDEAPGTSQLTYAVDLVGVDGRQLRLRAHKVVDSSVSLDTRQLWRAMTTLYVRISEPHGRCRELTVAMGVLRIRARDFVSQVLTLTPTGEHLLARAAKVASFVSYLSCKSLSFLLAPLAPLQYPDDPARPGRGDEPLPLYAHVPETACVAIKAGDGVLSRLHVWEPQASVIATENLFMVPGAGVDHQIFALPTIPLHAVDYFTRAGYRVFVPVHRICGLAGSRTAAWTTFDARLDLKACLEYIRKTYPRSGGRENKVYTIAHCMGSAALACGLLDGTIPADWLLGLSCSQVFGDTIWSPVNKFKATAPISMERFYSAMAGSWLDCSTSPDDSLFQQALNQLLRFFPEPRRELCNNASCHRVTFLFGRCWSHANLNEATHRHIDRFFSGATMGFVDMLRHMGRSGTVCTNAPDYTPLSTPENLELRMRGLPVLLFVGSENAVISPAATEKTYERLCNAFGMDAGTGSGSLQYRRRIVQGYGHLDCWMGRNAWRDVFPLVREEVDRVVRGEDYVSLTHPTISPPV